MATKQKLPKLPTKPALHKKFLAGASAVVLVLAATVGVLAHGAPRDEPLLSSLGGALAGLPNVNTTEKSYTTVGTAASTSIIVKFKPGTSAATADAVHAKLGGQVKRSISHLGAQAVSVPSGSRVGDTLAKYQSDPSVDYAEPNYMSRAFFTPNDTDYSKQWGLAKIGAPAAWDTERASTGKIAVVDTGADLNHPDLSGELAGGYNFVAGNSSPMDDNGHGTHVAGIIGAATNNAAGVASIGFHDTIMPVKVLDSTGSGTYADVASGIIYAADNGATLINMSLGGSSSSRTLQDAVNYAIGKGVIIVAAAGNNGTNAAVYPASYPGVIAVSASTSTDGLASFSSFGSDVKVAAPGVGIVSTYLGGGYASLSGTSMATPMVTGLLGLAASAHPASSGALVTAMEQTADKVGPYAYDANGWNQYFGYGRINAAKLIAALVGPTATPSPSVSPSPSPSASPKPRHGNKFGVTLEGTVDHTGAGFVSVKVKSGNDALGLATGTLVNLYVNDATSIQSTTQATASPLKPGDHITAQATWVDTKLMADNVTVLPSQAPSSDPNPAAQSGATAAPGRRKH